ncbi:MAG: 2Fe-2S iron-sulfur cluster-binding protein [Pseudomonadota bacterium]
MHKVHCTFLDGKEFEFECGPEENVISAARRQNIILPAYCMEGICGTCKVRLAEGEVDMGRAELGALSPTEEEEGYVLLCQAHPQTDLEVQFEIDSDRVTAPQEGKARIVEVGPASPSGEVYRIVLKAEFSDIFFWNPGQYVAINAPGTSEWRMFSMANTASMENVLEFYVRILPQGVFSNFLKGQAKVGDTLDIKGPYGLFFYNITDRPPVFIGGGTGLAPNLAMIRQLSNQFYPKRIRLFFGVTNPGDLHCKKEIESLQEALPDFVPYYACANADESWEGDKGFVTDSLLKHMGGEDFAGHEFYLCGPPPMIEAVEKILREKSVERSHIHREEFVPSGATKS